MEQRLNKKLLNYKKEDVYPFHMPGHKRNILKACSNEDSFGKRLSDMYSIDITEIDGFDNLHDAKDIILDAQIRAAKLYKSEETHFLVNGASGGILAAMAAVATPGSTVIVARNCHISVYNAVNLNGLNPVYVYPDIILKEDINSGISGSISKLQVEKAILENPSACAVVITSPTYDGVLSDIASIARIAHEYDMPLIVDEAHGALFFMEGRSAVEEGADIVINSVHKTLPALTQTALLHINGKLVDRNKVLRYLSIYQTSSPSYVLMGSIDYAVEIMEESGKSLYRDFCIRTVQLKSKLSKLRNLKYITKDNVLNEGGFDFDESKVLISTGEFSKNISGKDLYNVLLSEYKIQPEMAAGDYVLLMTTLFDSDEGIDRLVNALYEIDDRLKDISNKCSSEIKDHSCKENDVNNTKEACRLSELKECENNASPYTVFAYPPGIPIVVYGEKITDSIISEIKSAIDNNLDIKWIQ